MCDSFDPEYVAGNLALNHKIPETSALALVKAWYGETDSKICHQRIEQALKGIVTTFLLEKCGVPRFDDPDNIDPEQLAPYYEKLCREAKTFVSSCKLCPPEPLKSADEVKAYRDAAGQRVKAAMASENLPLNKFSDLLEYIEWDIAFELEWRLIHSLQPRGLAEETIRQFSQNELQKFELDYLCLKEWSQPHANWSEFKLKQSLGEKSPLAPFEYLLELPGAIKNQLMRNSEDFTCSFNVNLAWDSAQKNIAEYRESIAASKSQTPSEKQTILAT